VIATDVAGCREIVKHEYSGLLVPPGDAGALAAALLQLVNHPQRLTEMGHAGRALVMQRFTDDVVLRDTLAVYAST
jgi:glycosyltransferase involved in cell wall biosynthesis